MLKKVVIAAVAVLVGLVLVRKTEMGSLARLWWNNAKTCARQQVPPETEIERLRQEIANLGKDSRKHFSAIAEEKVAVENLEEQISLAKANLEKQERSILTMRNDLASDSQVITYGDNKYSRKQVEDQLRRDWASYHRAKADIETREQLLEARKAALNAARDQLAAMQDAQGELEVELARLEAELKTVRVAQTRSQFQLDDSDLSRIKAGVAALRDRINVEQRTLEVEAEFANGPVRVDAKSKQDVLKEIDSHFGKAQPEKVAAQPK